MAHSCCQRVPNVSGFVGRLVLRYAAMPTSHALIRCAIFGNPISLEDAKVSEDGKPVHEECYVAKLRLASSILSNTELDQLRGGGNGAKGPARPAKVEVFGVADEGWLSWWGFQQWHRHGSRRRHGVACCQMEF